jgi:hypothetical protein
MRWSETPVLLSQAPPAANSGRLFLQQICSEIYSFCSIRMSMGASAIIPKPFCELRLFGVRNLTYDMILAMLSAQIELRARPPLVFPAKAGIHSAMGTACARLTGI